MAKTLQFKRFSSTILANTVGASGELIIDSTKNLITVHDASTPGGWPVARESVINAINNAQSVNIQQARDTANASFVRANLAFVQINADLNLQGGLNSANANIALIQGSMVTSNANIAMLIGIKTTQNTNITTANNAAWAAFNKANNALANTSGTFGGNLNVAGTMNVNNILTVTTSPPASSPSITIISTQNQNLLLQAVSNTWTFDATGLLTFPDATVQTTAWTGASSITWPVTNTAGVGGPTKVAIGRYAGDVTQGPNAVAIGNVAGYSGQVAGAVAIGWQAGETTQGGSAVAIGSAAGRTSQGASAVAIGVTAGYTNQAPNAVAIGLYAGYTNQAANTIILNASGSVVNGVSNQTNSFYVAPIRNATGTHGVLQYNTSTKEVTYSGSLTFPDLSVQNTAFTGSAIDQTARNTANSAAANSAGVVIDTFARTTANTATNNVVIIQGVDTTQNTRITNVENTANAAYAKANTNISSDLTLTVTNSGVDAYLIDGASDPTLTLYRGVTYYFNINASGHPFYIQTVSGAYSSGNVYTSGVTGGGTQVGTLTFTVPLNAPNNLYYVCQNHSAMNGAFVIRNLISTINTQNNNISITQLKSLANSSATYSDFRTAIASL